MDFQSASRPIGLIAGCLDLVVACLVGGKVADLTDSGVDFR